MKKYIIPSSQVIKFELEGSLLSASSIDTNDRQPSVDNDANIFSEQKSPWSSDNWSEK